MSAISTKPNVPKKHSKLQETWRRFSKNGRAVVGLCIVIMLVLCAVLAPIISPYEPNAQDPRNRLQGPSAGHWFGTDELGRDILSRIIYGARISMSVGLIAICISLIGGVTLGAIAGYYGGTIDNIINALHGRFAVHSHNTFEHINRCGAWFRLAERYDSNRRIEHTGLLPHSQGEHTLP